MARSDETPRKGAKKKKKAAKGPPAFCSPTVQGPKIPGAEAKPKIGKARSPEAAKRPRYTRRGSGIGPAKDEVDRADRYVRGHIGIGGLSAHAEKVMRARELKRLLQPLTPSLVQVMSDIAHDRKVHPAIRLDAADRLLSRQFGRPTEKIEVTDPQEESNPDEVKTLLNRILESVGAPQLEFHDDGAEPDQPVPTIDIPEDYQKCAGGPT